MLGPGVDRDADDVGTVEEQIGRYRALAEAGVQRAFVGVVDDGSMGGYERFGAVIDFLDFHALGYHWPAFNVSDSAIVVGAALLLFDGLRSDRTAAGAMRGQTR